MSEENKYILQVKDLHTSFATDAGEVRAVNGVSFNLEPGKTLGIVGAVSYTHLTLPTTPYV